MVVELAVQKRDATKKPKSLRKGGVLPAVIYGRAHEATPVSIDAKTFGKVFEAAGESTVIKITGLGKEAQDALIHEVDFDPVSGQPVHADFYAIEKGQKVSVSVPLEFEGTSPAVKDLGGILTKTMYELDMEVEPAELPHAIMVDVSKLATLEDQIKIKDLTLPPSAKIWADPDEVVAMISVAQEEPVEEAAPADLSAIEISEDRGKKEEAGEGGEAPAAEEKKE